ncbi:MAG: hypothetical protein QM639_00110 [Rhodocyclaceae bacterium]
MKQKLIFRLIVGALAGAAVSASYAGQIQASSVSIAREVIVADDQRITSPVISYRFFGDVDARLQRQVFQVQFILGNGEWATAGAIASDNIKFTDGVTGAAVPRVATGVAPTQGQYEVTALNIAADKKTLYATITVYSDGTGSAAGLIKQPILSVAADALAANNPTIIKLKQVVGTVEECDKSVRNLPVEVKHYVALSQPMVLADDTNASPDEHKRGGSTNGTTLVTFPTNIYVQVEKSTGDARVDVANNSLRFTGSVGPGKTSYISPTVMNLGRFRLVQNANGYDANLLNNYLLAGPAGTPADQGVDGVTTATTGMGLSIAAAGEVEALKAVVKVSASQGFVNQSRVFLDTNHMCGTPITGTTVTINSTNAAGPITLKIPTTGINAAFGNTGVSIPDPYDASATPAPVFGDGARPVYVCYDVTGTSTPIPTSSFNIDGARLVKAPNSATSPIYYNEQDNYCKGPLYVLSGSIKIDVRNYASNAREDGWLSIIRLINNSETRTIDVYGQYIHRDGNYGKWGKLATLAPRAVLQMDPTAVNAVLTNAPAHANNAINATSEVATSGDAPRLRITSENGDTLRVQNYLYNPASQNFIEASGSQGVDYTGTSDRAPVSEGQYTEQDAQAGLNGGN